MISHCWLQKCVHRGRILSVPSPSRTNQRIFSFIPFHQHIYQHTQMSDSLDNTFCGWQYLNWNAIFTRSETKPSLFWVNNTVCEWTAQLMGLLGHIVDFTLHTDWVLPLMRKYAVRTFGLWGVWLIWSTESHLRGDKKSAREPREQIVYQGNLHPVIPV